MSETGASQEQIEAAKARINDGAPVPMTRMSEATVELIAENLVPPTHRIIGPDEIAAIGRVWEYADARYRYAMLLKPEDDARISPAFGALTADDFATVKRLAGAPE